MYKIIFILLFLILTYNLYSQSRDERQVSVAVQKRLNQKVSYLNPSQGIKMNGRFIDSVWIAAHWDTTKRVFITASDSGVLVIYGSIIINGDMEYEYPHAVAGADSINYSVGGDKGVFYKVNTGLLIIKDTLKISVVGDSIRPYLFGDYNVYLGISATTANANDQIYITVKLSNDTVTRNIRRFIINSNGNAGADTKTMNWYLKHVSPNSWLSFYVKNLTGAREVIINDIGFILEKTPQRKY